MRGFLMCYDWEIVLSSICFHSCIIVFATELRGGKHTVPRMLKTQLHPISMKRSYVDVDLSITNEGCGTQASTTEMPKFVEIKSQLDRFTQLMI
ncbi:hypothetical protein P8452_69354 [Trifolium repens]|nr:hypothetical protein P8452_69354 [Trifolium repens]